MKKYNANSGWFNESKRHSLARLGVKTGRKVDYSIFSDLRNKKRARETESLLTQTGSEGYVYVSGKGWQAKFTDSAKPSDSYTVMSESHPNIVKSVGQFDIYYDDKNKDYMVMNRKTGELSPNFNTISNATDFVNSKKVDYAWKDKLKWGAIATGAGTVGTSVVQVVGKSNPLTWSVTDIEPFLIDVTGVTMANVVRAVPYIAIGGVVVATGFGIKKLIELHKKGKISKQQLKEKVTTAIENKEPVVVTNNELS
jgi:hypothetical protein